MKYTTKDVSLYGFVIVLIVAILSGIVVFIFLNKLEVLNAKNSFYEKSYETIFQYKYYTSKLLSTHNLEDARIFWFKSKNKVGSMIKELKELKETTTNDNIDNFWSIINSESKKINNQLNNKLFDKKNILNKSILRRLGERINSNKTSDYYNLLTDIRNSIIYLEQYEEFLLDEINLLKNRQQLSIFTKIEETKKAGVILALIIICIGIIFIFFIYKLIAKVEFKLIEKEKMMAQQSKMASMGEMLENIAHQWRQPLSVISTASSGIIMQKEFGLSSEEKEIETLNLITDSAKHLSKTINDFRDFFKTHKKKVTFSVKEIYKKTVALLESKFKNRSIEVIENIEDIELYDLDSELIQVIMNILNNARDILENKDKEYRKLIFIDIYRENNNAILKIKDNGGGVPENIINNIFEPYFTTKHKSQGTGIGLYMSEEIIKKHMKGDLTVSNEQYEYEGKIYTGACFTIVLSIKKEFEEDLCYNI